MCFSATEMPELDKLVMKPDQAEGRCHCGKKDLNFMRSDCEDVSLGRVQCQCWPMSFQNTDFGLKRHESDFQMNQRKRRKMHHHQFNFTENSQLFIILVRSLNTSSSCYCTYSPLLWPSVAFYGFQNFTLPFPWCCQSIFTPFMLDTLFNICIIYWIFININYYYLISKVEILFH